MSIEKKLLKKKMISTVFCEKYLVYQHGYTFFVFFCYYGCHHCSPFLPAKQVKEFFKLVEYLGASLVMGLLSALYGIKIFLILVYFIHILLPFPLYEI